MSEFRRAMDFSRSPLFRQSGLSIHDLGIGRLRCPTAIIELFEAALKETPRNAPYVRLVDTEGREAGVYISTDALNLLLRLRDLFENPEELQTLLQETIDEEEYQDANLEKILNTHA